MDIKTLKDLEARKEKAVECIEMLKKKLKETREVADGIDAAIHEAIVGLPLFDAETGEETP